MRQCFTNFVKEFLSLTDSMKHQKNVIFGPLGFFGVTIATSLSGSTGDFLK